MLRKPLLTAVAFTIATLNVNIALAEPVVLRSNDGSTSITGELVSFEDGTYTVQTVLGQMQLSAARVSCEGADCPDLSVDVGEVDFAITGANTIGDELIPLLLEGFATTINAEADILTSADSTIKYATLIDDQGFGEPFAVVMVESSETPAAFNDLLDGSAQIGMADRRIDRTEARALRSAGAGSMIDFNQERIIAVDSLLVLVEESNPITELTIEQLALIYSGQITNWRDVGGLDMAINVYSFPEESGTETTFSDRILHPRNLHTKSDANFVENHIDMSRAVVNDPAGIGYAGFAFQRGAKSLDLISECGIIGSPNEFSAKTEEYPLARRLYLYNRADTMTDQSQEFLDYVTSAEADGLVSKSGFINLSVTRRLQDERSLHLREYIRNTSDQFEVALMSQLLVEMLDWDRLSTTFRFPSGSTALDNKAQRDLERLISFLENQPDGTQVAVVGFTDDRGPFTANQSLSEVRASSVISIIESFAGNRIDGIEMMPLGFGEVSPADCNETDYGRATNRRVEIWVRNSAL